MKTMLDLISITLPTNTRIVKDIRTLTDFLLLQQQQYRSISGNYVTYYGFETKPTPLPVGLTSVIVSELSAVPPTAPASQRIEMSTNHTRISKFDSVADENLQRLVSPIRTIAQDSQRRCQERWQKFKGQSLSLPMFQLMTSPQECPPRHPGQKSPVT